MQPGFVVPRRFDLAPESWCTMSRTGIASWRRNTNANPPWTETILEGGGLA